MDITLLSAKVFMAAKNIGGEQYKGTVLLMYANSLPERLMPKMVYDVPDKYHSLFDSLPYATPVSTSKERVYDRVLDLSFGLGGKPEAWWQSNKTRFKFR